MKKNLLLLILFLVPFSGFCRKTQEERFVKRHYKETFRGIQEFALRLQTNNKEKQKEEIHRQCHAYKAIVQALKNHSDPKTKKAITTALLRWNWLEGDLIFNNPNPVDWHMAYMECLYKKQKR